MLDKVIEEGAKKFRTEFEPVFAGVVKKIDDIAGNIANIQSRLSRLEAGMEELKRR